MKNSFFVPGLWFNPAGPIGKSIQKSFNIVDQCGIPSLQQRVDDLREKLPQVVDTLVAHSAGCTVVAELLKRKDFMAHQVILLNPAPSKGVRFGIKDPIFWIMMKLKYQIAMNFGHKFMLNEADVMNLLSVSREKIIQVMENLKDDSGAFANELTYRQFRKAESFATQLGRLAIVSCTSDRMMGKSWKKTEKILQANNPDAVIHHYDHGH